MSPWNVSRAISCSAQIERRKHRVCAAEAGDLEDFVSAAERRTVEGGAVHEG
jgi:hypothetical protein